MNNWKHVDSVCWLLLVFCCCFVFVGLEEGIKREIKREKKEKSVSEKRKEKKKRTTLRWCANQRKKQNTAKHSKTQQNTSPIKNYNLHHQIFFFSPYLFPISIAFTLDVVSTEIKRNNRVAK